MITTVSNTLMQDLRYALRQMRRAPGFALVTVLTLALGVGAAAAVFSVMDAMLIRPLPFNHPERILVTRTLSISGYTQPFSLPDFRDIRDRFTTLDAFAGYETGSVNLQNGTDAVALHVVNGSDNFFSVFAVKPVLGRTFYPGEEKAGRNNVAVLSYEVWQQNFAGDPGVVGRTVLLDGRPSLIIGVMPAGFRFSVGLSRTVYMPFRNEEQSWRENRGSHWMRTIARLKPGVSAKAADAELVSLMSNLAHAYPDEDAGRTGSFQTLQSEVLGSTTTSLWLLAGAAAALLGIACANVGGLLLARAVKREREMALRCAVGAARGRLIRQIATESLVLAVASDLLGIGFAYALLAGMRAYLIKALARGADVHLDWTALTVTLLLALLTSVLASLLPALRLSSLNPNTALKAGGKAGGGRSQNRLRATFLVAQVTLSLTLLSVAALLMQSLSRLRGTETGFDPDHILSLEIDLSPGGYANRNPLTAFYKPLLERIRHTPGVTAAGLINMLPVQSFGSNSDVQIVGHPPAPKNQEHLAEVRYFTEGYFETMGIPLMQGRMLTPGLDRTKSENPPYVVNEAFRRKFFSAGESPLGARVEGDPKDPNQSVIQGVTGSVRQNLLVPPMAEMDVLMDTMPEKYSSGMTNLVLVLRTTGDPKQLIPSLRTALHETDPAVPMHMPETLREVMSDQLVLERMESVLFGIFAGLAVLLAMAGLYGLVSQEVESGTRDIGVRMALGATRTHVLGRILRRVAFLVGCGAVLGVALTLLTRKVFASVVELQTSRDGTLLVLLVLFMLVLGLLAALLPARRAANTQPVEALRSE
ncbi:ABC transporter permease [Terriglobus sp.]|uniref:ABC transporter permease n=1 Tax=Terriglobus sp. TaxID=1889013 RepID=UPI003B006CA9